MTDHSSVIALSKLYSLNDPRLAQITVKGDLIIANDERIKTRSHSKQSMSPAGPFKASSTSLDALARRYSSATDPVSPDPDQFTVIPAPLKIIKLLIDELGAASGQQAAANAASAAVAGDFDSDDEDDGWEDDDDTLDMGLAATKADLMSFIEGPGRRAPDDETQSFLTQFFLECAKTNTADFQQLFNGLSEEEKQKLNELAPGQ